MKPRCKKRGLTDRFHVPGLRRVRGLHMTYCTVPYSRNDAPFKVGVYSFDGIGRHHVEKPDQGSLRGRFPPPHLFAGSMSQSQRFTH